MNRKVHLISGGILYLAYVYVTGFFHDITPELFVYGIVAVTLGSLFPDIIEPATGARHRRICHSWRALKLMLALFLVLALAISFSPGIPRYPLAFSASCFFLGYAVHLIADSLTRAGLPD
ncbi:metal-dependent hydrolase [uncultured Methanoregula sp.]|uniref:metal-dependent hydrolase n=1 Tax=uncultured Methanoregula sp. TaxID=1005933 RepID=UPI002AAB81FE|nr:metal-dependent hydrolase [uncultured Methanoregula sp.]